MKSFVFIVIGLLLIGSGVHDNPYLVGAGISSIALAGFLAV